MMFMNKKYFLIVILFSIFIYSSYHLILWSIDNNHTKVINDTIKENIKIKNLSNNNELINAPDNKKDDIYKFQDESFLEVDFNDLINIKSILLVMFFSFFIFTSFNFVFLFTYFL